MPTYEFRCRDCGERFSVQLPWQEKDKAVCPSCGGKDLQQLFTGITILGRSSSESGSCAAPAGGRFS
ncbi:MAG: FmdB family zinc ribbon protein [Moorellaceae bacterium]